MNLKRRHLTQSQKAAVAVDMLPLLEKEAREKKIQSLSKQERGENGTFKPNTQKIEEAAGDKNESTAANQAAKLMGTNRQYVSDTKKIKQEAPEVFDMLKRGDKTAGSDKSQL